VLLSTIPIGNGKENERDRMTFRPESVRLRGIHGVAVTVGNSFHLKSLSAAAHN
jgi:hypothetical protein